MKNSNVNRFLILITVIVLTSLPAYCMQTIKQTAIKFVFAMCGVVVSSLIIYFGLTLYNKMFITKSFNEKENKINNKRIPENISDAVDFFIIKNKLR